MPLGRIDEETVANIGTIDGGEARNIVADVDVLQGMARSHDQAKLDAQIAAMRKAFEEAAARYGASVDFERGDVPHLQDRGGRPAYVEAAAAIDRWASR